jgi:hypothetical protein
MEKKGQVPFLSGCQAAHSLQDSVLAMHHGSGFASRDEKRVDLRPICRSDRRVPPWLRCRLRMSMRRRSKA